eukprot:gene57439-biopygen50818
MSGVSGAGAMDGVLYTVAPLGHLPVAGAVQQAVQFVTVDDGAECQGRTVENATCTITIAESLMDLVGCAPVRLTVMNMLTQLPQPNQNVPAIVSQDMWARTAALVLYAIARHRTAAVTIPTSHDAPAPLGAAEIKRAQSRRGLLSAGPMHDAASFPEVSTSPSEQLHSGAAPQPLADASIELLRLRQ